MRAPFRPFRTSRGLAGMEYGLLVGVFVALAIAFAAMTSGALRTGLDAAEADFSQSDTLDVVTGPITVPQSLPEVPVAQEEGLELVEGHPSSAVVGQPYHFSFRQYLRAPEGVNARALTWSLTANEALPVGFAFSSQTGVLTGTFQGGSPVELVLRVTVSDGTSSAVRSYHWAAREQGLFLLPAALPFAGPGAPYAFDFERLVELPSNIPLTSLSWSVLPQTLPSGITATSSPPRLQGALQGGLPASGEVLVQVAVGGDVASRTYTVQTPPFWLRQVPEIRVVSGEDVLVNFAAASFLETEPGLFADDVAWTITTLDAQGEPAVLPEGLNLTGQRITGQHRTPTDSVFLVRVQASVEGFTQVRTYPMRVAAALFLTGGELAEARTYTLYSTNLGERLVVAPGVDGAGVRWSVSSGDLPAGFTLDPNTGVLSGRFRENREATFSFGVTASIVGGPRDTAAFVLPVVFGETLRDGGSLPTAFYGVPYTYDLKNLLSARDSASYTWEMSGAPLPSGLSLNPTTGIISGTPTPLEDHLDGGALTGTPLSVIVRASTAFPARMVQETYTWPVNGLAPFQSAVGGLNACALDERGQAWCWGRRTANGILGNPDVTSPNALLPERVVGVARPLVQIDMNATTVCGVDDTGQIWCWGSNLYGQFGNGESGADSAVPMMVDQSSMGLGVTSMTVGTQHVCALSQAGESWCWGAGSNGRLGNNSTAAALRPVPTATSTGMTARLARVDAGVGSTCAVEETGDLWCWGTGGNGRLGRGSAAIATRPVRVVTDTGLVKALDVSVGNNHACAVAVDGNVWCWGNFATRRLGSNQTVDQWSPILVPLVNGVGPVNATRVTSSDVLTCAYDDVGGRAWCWGTNNGRLGNGTTAAGGALPAPVITSGMVGRLMGINSGPSAASGCGWTDERALYCWGSGTSGQLGVTPSLITTGTPVRVQFPGIAP